MTGAVQPVVEWAAASAALERWSECGDAYVVVPFAGGALAAAIDGLGHGSEAAVAARAAVDVLAERPADTPVDLIHRCHVALRRTRGAVMTVASFDTSSSTMTWSAVGNVDAVLLRAGHSTRAREVIIASPGVVGYQLSRVRSATLPIAATDLVLFATDGVGSHFASERHMVDDLQHCADAILSTAGKGTDDALVLVVRYLGARP